MLQNDFTNNTEIQCFVDAGASAKNNPNNLVTESLKVTTALLVIAIIFFMLACLVPLCYFRIVEAKQAQQVQPTQPQQVQPTQPQAQAQPTGEYAQDEY